MRRADRLFQIIQYLRGRRLTTARQLAERLEVSERTIYRDIRDLSLCGVPVEGEAGVGYILRQGYLVPPLMFTPDEIEALVAGARWVRSWAGPDLARAADEALVKIESVLPESLGARIAESRVFAPDFHGYADNTPLLDRIRAAINQRRTVAFDYTREDGQCSHRRIRPLGLFFWGAVWTLAGWCEWREDFRNFRIDRIRNLEVSGDGFSETPEISLQAMIAHYKSQTQRRSR